MRRRYQVLPPTAPVPAPDDVLEQVVREGAQRMLQAALLEEVASFLGRPRYNRGSEFRGYRNGSLPERTIATGMGSVTIRQPRVSAVPVGIDPFQSEIVSRWARQSRTQLRLFARLYLVWLSSGDFEPFFRALVGETTALSAASILRLRQEWEDEYRLWRGRPLSIPRVRDRILQTAARLVLEPIFEASFLPGSYGFRPRRSAHQALESIRRRSTRARGGYWRSTSGTSSGVSTRTCSWVWWPGGSAIAGCSG